ncbi:type II secretion system F family protein [Allorhodopirellula solitaria]|uniref:Type IV pilin biogenesis protein n=1 Tax=Allorhodopirellula solitaria TaxID=2527987 RepID=A0A5C5YKH4_9BACT|nr:type II secretion system F family protein [Allorhodopirellula solitaria]TWT75410.1 type IV pilin biogenesis protein [Allorhodopirellula solitaria]
MNRIISHSFQVTAPHERALVRVLLMSQRRRLDPAAMVDRLAVEFSHRRSRVLRQVARLLADGTPVVDALEQTPEAIDPAALLLLRLGTETGTYPETLQSLIASDAVADPMLEARASSIETQFIQAAGGFLIAALVISFFMLFISPTFVKMFEEFEVPIPAAMTWFMAIGQYFPWLIIPGFVLYLMALFVRPLFFNRVKWPLGLRRRMPQAAAQLLDLLSVTLQSGRPLSAGIATLARVHPVSRIRRRLIDASRSIDRGENEWQALANCHFVSPANGEALQLTEDRFTQAWLLRRSAKQRSVWANLRSAFLVRSVSMVLLLILAAIVMLAAVGMFSCIYSLVGALA